MKLAFFAAAAIAIGASAPAAALGQSVLWNVDVDVDVISQATARLVAGDPLSDDLRSSLVADLEFAASNIADDAFMERLEAAVEEYGDVDGFAAHVLADQYAGERVGGYGPGMPSTDDVHDVVNTLRENGGPSSWFAEAANLLQQDAREDGAFAPGGVCADDCRNLRTAADYAFKAAAVACVLFPGPACAFAVGAAVGLQAHAEATCAICG